MRFSVNNGVLIPGHGKKYEVLYEIITENWVLNCKTGIMKKIIYILFGMLAWWSCEDENSLIGPEESFSEYTDSRDGKIYRCVTIGDQTWMAFGLPSAFLGSVDGCYMLSGGEFDTNRIEPARPCSMRLYRML